MAPKSKVDEKALQEVWMELRDLKKEIGRKHKKDRLCEASYGNRFNDILSKIEFLFPVALMPEGLPCSIEFASEMNCKMTRSDVLRNCELVQKCLTTRSRQTTLALRDLHGRIVHK